ncbi:hypothetical protein BGZ52_000415, partial [Haplosporangium bisporale]
MVLKSTIAFVAVATLAFLSSGPQAEAHSWADCIDWKFKDPKKPSWNDDGGRCIGKMLTPELRFLAPIVATAMDPTRPVPIL